MPDQIDSPASPLAILLAGERKQPALTILSGPPGAGKSSWCWRLAEEAHAVGLTIGGLVSPAVLVDGRKIGIDLVDLSTSERRPLAILHRGDGVGLTTDQWQFDEAVLAWGNRLLAQQQTVDLLILDELGPLEFERGQGLQAGLSLVDNRELPWICVVIRPSLLDSAGKRWPWAEVLTLPAGPGPLAYLETSP